MQNFERAVLYITLLATALAVLWSRGGDTMSLELRYTFTAIILLILVILALKAFWWDKKAMKSSAKPKNKRGTSYSLDIKADTADIAKMNTEQIVAFRELIAKRPSEQPKEKGEKEALK